MAADEAVENPITEDGIVKVEWQDPKSFRDVKASGDIQSRFEARTFKELTKNLNKEAAKILKPNQKLEMVVTDLDLAGDVRPTFGATTNDLRVVKDLYPPRITFSYKITEGEQVIITQGLAPGDLVAALGAFKLQEGLLVHVVERLSKEAQMAAKTQ